MEKKIAVFDFDNTLYSESSRSEFFKYVTDKMLLRKAYMLPIGALFALHKLKLLSKTKYKELFFQYLDYIPPKKLKKYAEDFWKKESNAEFNPKLLKRLKKLQKDKVETVVITGGPEFYLKPAVKNLGIDKLIGTRLEYKNGKYKIKGKSCDGPEKIKRLDKVFKGASYEIEEAYSDKKEEILKVAKKSFLVKKKKNRSIQKIKYAKIVA